MTKSEVINALVAAVKRRGYPIEVDEDHRVVTIKHLTSLDEMGRELSCHLLDVVNDAIDLSGAPVDVAMRLLHRRDAAAGLQMEFEGDLITLSKILTPKPQPK